MSEPPASPYKGLNAFEDSELDALLFFGRERETEIVVANLIASRLTVLYGPSGVGKSSLLRAAVARALRQLPEEPLVVVFSSWSDDPNVALAQAVGETTGVDVDGSAAAALEEAQTDRDVYLVLDQAEEYFLYHADDSGAGSFAEALPTVLGTQLRVNVLISLREDSLAKLDRFTGRIPSLFANTLRLDRLDRQSARAAILRPVDRYSELTGVQVEVEPPLAEHVLDEVGAGQIEPALGGLGAVEGGDETARIEAPYLQLVMQRLWDEERGSGSSVLRADTLKRLGGAQQIVEEHLDSAIERLDEQQKDVAARLFNHLITPSGTKIAHEESDLADFGHVSREELLPVLNTLSERRILRSLDEGGDRRFEIFHDVLAQPVLAWRTRHRTQREIEHRLAESHRRRRRLQWLFAAVLVALCLMTAVTVYALDQRSEARRQAGEAKAHQLEALSAAELGSDPQLGLLLALEAAKLRPTQTAVEALRQAVLASRVRSIFWFGEPLLAAAASPRGVIGVTSDGVVVTKDLRTGRTRTTTRTGVRATDASFATDGTALVTGRDGRVRVVGPGGGTLSVAGVTDARGAALSDDARLAAVIAEQEVRLIDVESGRVLRTFTHPGAISAAISPEARRVVTGGTDEIVRVWSVARGGLIRRLDGQDGRPVAVDYSPRGDFVASASTDGLGRVWHVDSGGLISTLAGHGNQLTDVDFSTDGTQVVTASRDRTGRVWRADSGAELLVLAGHTERVLSAAFLGGAGSTVVTASPDESARLWDALIQPELRVLAQLRSPVTVVGFPGAGRVEATTPEGSKVFSLTTGEELDGGSAAPLERTRRVVAPDGTVATIRGNTVVVRSESRTTVLKGHRDRVTSVAFSADGRRLVTASRDNDARIWSVATGKPVRTLQGHFGPVNDARFSPDGRWVVTAGPRTAGLWDARSGVLVMYLRGHRGRVLSVGFDPSGRFVVSGGEDGTLREYRCDFCGGLDELTKLARKRLAETGRELTPEEREQYLR